jgi:uncharacterized protein (TIGR00369 family)
METFTHLKVVQELCGRPLELRSGYSQVRLQATAEMRADANDLVHGGFVFGMADYAAMLAVNHPYVVLGSANVRFMKPVVVGEDLIAEAKVLESGSTREDQRDVDVTVKRGDTTVFAGRFVCFVLEQHILA